MKAAGENVIPRQKPNGSGGTSRLLAVVCGDTVFLHTYLNSVVIRVKEWYNPLEVRFSMIDKICNEIKGRLEREHIKKVGERELLLISSQYPGLWLEHVYDAVLYAKMDRSKVYLAKNTIEVFVEKQKDGQYPFNLTERNGEVTFGYSQIQECVSFLSLALEVSELLCDPAFDKKVYDSGVEWISWLENNRMTLKKGLVEMFVGFDTGHDNSGRLNGLLCKGNYTLPDGTRANAAVLPEGEKVAPIIAVDMNCNFFGDLMALSRFAKKLGLAHESLAWKEKAQKVKARLFEICYDKEDAFFYDVDRDGNKRKYLSSTIFHLFLEKLLDRETDKALINEIYARHIKNENEFWTEYPFPSMAICDASCKSHADLNCWGYYTQGLIVLRAIRWMDDYGMQSDFDYICRKWLEAWTDCFDDFKLGQELDPVTGKPTKSSQWYSSCMLMYLYAAQRLRKCDK